jgi:hypothetical protein
VVVDDVLPLGFVVVVVDDPEPLADGVVVVVLPVDPLTEPEPVVVLLPPGVVVVVVVLLPGEADGGVVRSGVLPTRSVSVRLHAAVVPASSARAQSPDSIFFISNAPPCGVIVRREGVQRPCPQPDLTGSYTFLTTAGYPARAPPPHERRRVFP